jgi:FSR family fosmidomycin resistance protein-like MFS transporter
LLVGFSDELWSGVAVVAAPSLEQEQALDHRGYTLFVFVLPLLLSAALDAVLSLLCDWLPRQRLRALGLAGLSLGLVLVALAPTASGLSLGLALAGAASGLACSAAQADLIGRHDGNGEIALTRWAFFGGLGDLASPLVVASVFGLGGSYRGALVVIAALSAVQALAALRAPRTAPALAVPQSSEPEAAEPELPVWRALRAAAGQRRLWLWLIGSGLCTLLDEIVLAFASLRLSLDLGASDAVAASSGVVLSLGATLGAALTERLLPSVPARRLLLMSALACLCALAWVVAAPSAGWLTPALFLLGVSAAPHYPLLEARAYAELPGRPGLVRALAQVMVLIEVLAPAALGAIAQALGLAAALGALVLQPLAILGLLWITRQPRSPRHGSETARQTPERQPESSP